MPCPPFLQQHYALVLPVGQPFALHIDVGYSPIAASLVFSIALTQTRRRRVGADEALA